MLQGLCVFCQDKQCTLATIITNGISCAFKNAAWSNILQGTIAFRMLGPSLSLFTIFTTSGQLCRGLLGSDVPVLMAETIFSGRSKSCRVYLPQGK